MESGIYNTRGVLQTYSDVFQINKLSSNILGYNE